MKIKLLLIVFVITTNVFGQVQTKPKATKKVVFEKDVDLSDKGEWVLAFEDNFDGEQLDLSKWKPIDGVLRGVPDFGVEKQWYSPRNIEIKNGILKLIAKKETLKNQGFDIWYIDDMKHFVTDFEYTSGEIDSRQKFSYGKYEIRCKIPKGMGFWPAFWIYGGRRENGKYFNNELDVFEFWENKYTQHNMTSHYDGKSQGTDYKGVDFSLDFHVFTLIWLPNRIEWWVDGKLKRQDAKYSTFFKRNAGTKLKAGKTYRENLIFPKDSMQILANMALQSQKHNKPNAQTVFPSAYEIDYIRYYKKQ